MKRLIALSLILPALLLAKGDGTGENTSEFLEISQGVRASGMGGAFVAVADDIQSIYGNPAGLAKSEKKELLASRSFWLADTAIDLVAYSQPISFIKGVLGGGIVLMNTNGGKGDDGNNLKVKCLSLSASYGRYITKDISAGATMRFINQDYANYKGSGFAYDAGFLADVNTFSIGISLSNVGGDIKIDNADNPLPTKIIAGLGYKTSFYERPAIISFDLEKSKDQEVVYHLGAEYQIIPKIDVRCGYNTLSGYSTGFGYRSYGRETLETLLGQIDYAYLQNKGLENSHKFSILTRF
ncbi:PorV/PorQ family protein [bacterium]|nr:PorV/PorQ family protein [bacterium]MBU1599329.1 PorV/PorQ family protein [bacterium]